MSDRRHERKKRFEALVDVAPGSLGEFVRQWLDYLRVPNYAAASLTHREHQMRYFLVWCGDRGLTRPVDITVDPPLLPMDGEDATRRDESVRNARHAAARTALAESDPLDR